MSEEVWICRECAKSHNWPLDTTNRSNAGGRWHWIHKVDYCPLCRQVRQLVRVIEKKRTVAA